MIFDLFVSFASQYYSFLLQYKGQMEIRDLLNQNSMSFDVNDNVSCLPTDRKTGSICLGSPDCQEDRAWGARAWPEGFGALGSMCRAAPINLVSLAIQPWIWAHISPPPLASHCVPLPTFPGFPAELLNRVFAESGVAVKQAWDHHLSWAAAWQQNRHIIAPYLVWLLVWLRVVVGLNQWVGAAWLGAPNCVEGDLVLAYC